MDIAFIQGIIPAVTQDHATKPKPPAAPYEEVDWEDYIDDENEEWHKSVYDF